MKVFYDPKYYPKNKTPLVTGDPEVFVLSSNHLRSFIALVRNSPDAGAAVLECLKSFETVLDQIAKPHAEAIPHAIVLVDDVDLVVKELRAWRGPYYPSSVTPELEGICAKVDKAGALERLLERFSDGV